MATPRNTSNKNTTTSLILCCYLMSLAQWAPARVAGGGFDLNELPEINEGSVNHRQREAAKKATGSVAAAARVVTTGQRQGKKMTPEFYAKVQKLMSVLAICDRPITEYYLIDIPEDFSAQRKAMMALDQLGKSRLILKKDIHQYDRIMSNCRRVAQEVNAKTESKMSVDSQYSGGTWEERVRRIQEGMKLSVLDNFRERLSGQVISSPKSLPVTTTTPEPPRARAGLGLRVESPKSSSTEKVSYFNFF